MRECVREVACDS